MNRAATILQDVITELSNADAKHGPMPGPVGGWFTLLIETLELGREIFQENRDQRLIRGEAVQVAAMGVKFLRDCCREGEIDGR